jgi:nucleotide-binding universal stress UspA family protein
MTTRLLVPIDESPWSGAAVGLAFWIAQQSRDRYQSALVADAASENRAHPGKRSPVEIEALHVVGVTHVSGRWIDDLSGLLGFEPIVVPAQVEAFYRERGKKLLDAVLERARTAAIPATQTLVTGNVVDTICAHGAASDLIVMGLRGETEERFPGQGGATTERVIRYAPVSTLVVPQGMARITAIGLGYDGSDGARRALRATAHLAELLGAQVHAICVGDAPPDLGEVEEQLTSLGVGVTVHRVDGEPREALPNEALKNGCDLLVLGYRGRSAIKDIFLGRTTEWLVGHVDMGILVAR